jgi:hypothetical protein
MPECKSLSYAATTALAGVAGSSQARHVAALIANRPATTGRAGMEDLVSRSSSA